MQDNEQVFKKFKGDHHKLDQFWKRLHFSKKPAEIKTEADELEIHAKEMQNRFLEFKSKIAETSFAAAIHCWLREQMTNSENEEEGSLKEFEFLIDHKIVPLYEEKSKKVWTIGHQKQIGHQYIVECIRSLSDRSILQREKYVSLYLQFARYLSNLTFGYIPFEEDPDKQKTKGRSITLEQFIDFASHLPERDALIAALIYFGGISINEVIDLKISSIDFKKYSISFLQVNLEYPKHIIHSLEKHVNGKKKNDLVFTNRTGEAVDRTWIYRSFKNASSKMTPSLEITPANLSL